MPQISLNIDQTTLEKIESVAKQNKISVSNWVGDTIKKLLEDTMPIESTNTTSGLFEEKCSKLVKEGRMITARNIMPLQMPKITEKEKNIDWEKIYNETREDRF
jgi:pyruvate-formate lyase